MIIRIPTQTKRDKKGDTLLYNGSEAIQPDTCTTTTPFYRKSWQTSKEPFGDLGQRFWCFWTEAQYKQYPVVFSFILRYLDKLKLGIKRSGGMHPTWLCFKQEADSYTIITSKPSGNLVPPYCRSPPTTAIPMRKGFLGVTDAQSHCLLFMRHSDSIWPYLISVWQVTQSCLSKCWELG